MTSMTHHEIADGLRKALALIALSQMNDTTSLTFDTSDGVLHLRPSDMCPDAVDAYNACFAAIKLLEPQEGEF